jgi:hypothetical protein
MKIAMFAKVEPSWLCGEYVRNVIVADENSPEAA